MRASHLLTMLLLAGIAACSGPGAQEPVADPVPEEGAGLAATVEAASAPVREPRQWSREDVSLAFKCHGLLSAAFAARTILPEAERPESLDSLTMGSSQKWTIEAFARADEAGISSEEQNQMMSSATRVLATREALEQALPDIEDCASQMP